MTMVDSSQLNKSQAKPHHPFKKRRLSCYLTVTKKSRVRIFIILTDTSPLLSSPDQMVDVVLLNCIFTVFPLRLPCLLLLDLSDVSALLACGVWQMADLLVKCWADLDVIPFYFLVFGGVSVNSFAFLNS